MLKPHLARLQQLVNDAEKTRDDVREELVDARLATAKMERGQASESRRLRRELHRSAVVHQEPPLPSQRHLIEMVAVTQWFASQRHHTAGSLRAMHD